MERQNQDTHNGPRRAKKSDTLARARDNHERQFVNVTKTVSEVLRLKAREESNLMIFLEVIFE